MESDLIPCSQDFLGSYPMKKLLKLNNHSFVTGASNGSLLLVTAIKEGYFIISPTDKEGIRQFLIGKKVIYELHNESKITWALRSTPLQMWQIEENVPLMDFCAQGMPS